MAAVSHLSALDFVVIAAYFVGVIAVGVWVSLSILTVTFHTTFNHLMPLQLKRSGLETVPNTILWFVASYGCIHEFEV